MATHICSVFCLLISFDHFSDEFLFLLIYCSSLGFCYHRSFLDVAIFVVVVVAILLLVF